MSDDTFVDEHGTTWNRPTAEAYYRVCKANDANRKRADEACAKLAEETEWENGYGSLESGHMVAVAIRKRFLNV